MSGRFTGSTSEKGMARLIFSGIGIGFVIALVLFGLKTLVSQAKTSKTIIWPTSTTVRVISPTAEVSGEEDKVTATPTPILFQFDQMWAAVGDPAPGFSLKSLEGKTVQLSDHYGSPIIINFWATWCQFCEEEMTALQADYDKYRDAGLVVLGINVIEKDDLGKVTEFVSDLGLTFPILLDTETSTNAAKYGVSGLPSSYFIDSYGVLRRIQIGAMTQDTIEKYTQEILPE